MNFLIGMNSFRDKCKERPQNTLLQDAIKSSSSRDCMQRFRPTSTAEIDLTVCPESYYCYHYYYYYYCYYYYYYYSLR